MADSHLFLLLHLEQRPVPAAQRNADPAPRERIQGQPVGTRLRTPQLPHPEGTGTLLRRLPRMERTGT